MTNFNFLSNNLSYLSSEDHVGRPMDSTCFRSAPVPPSFRLRLHPLRMVATLLLLLCLGVGNVWGIDASAYKEAKFGSTYNSIRVSSYTDSWSSTYNSFKVNIANGNNNNNGWSYIKFGRKNNASVGSIITDATIDKKITKVEVVIDELTANKINSIKLYISADKSSWTEAGTFSKAAGTQKVYIPASNQSANRYYKIEFDCASGSSNGLIQISSVKFYRSSFTVTYDNNGGSGSATDSNSPYDTASVVATKAANTFTAPTSHTFNGWNTQANGSGTSYAAGATFTISANTTLYAQWESAAPAYTITTQSNNNSLGTVSLTGSVITATPAACCEYASPAYTVSPVGNATVTKGTGANINKFTVSELTGNVTVTINFQAKDPGKTVNFDAGAGSCATSSLTETCDGSGVVLPSVTASGVCKGWTTFAGWRTSAIAAADSTTTNPGTLYAAGTTYYPSSNNETLYAVFSKTKGSAPTWTIVSDATSLAAGDSVIIAASGSAYAMSTTQNTNNRGQAGITKSGDNLSAITSGVQKFVLKAGTSSGTWAFYDGAKYIYAASSSSNHLKSQTTNDANGSFTISISSKVATITANGTNTNKVMQHNSGSNLFSCYGSASQSALALYKKIGGYTTYYCSDPNCCTALGTINGSVLWSNGTLLGGDRFSRSVGRTLRVD